jgi:outer membrane protein assembly factor BamB
MKYFILLFALSLPIQAQHIQSRTELDQAVESCRQWPSYRGFMAKGWLDQATLPDSFNLESGHHVKWNIGIPGLGLSCPVIWDDHIYITTAVSEEDQGGYKTGMYGDIAPVQDSSVHSWMVYCIDKESGEIRWEKEAHRGIPSVRRHPKSSHANTSVATDGQHVVAFFGSEGLYCYDREGHLLWEKDLGFINSSWHIVPSAEWEFSSSPLIFNDKVILQADALNTAFVTVLDLATGETLWSRERDEIPGWCSPNVYFDGSKARVVVNGYRHRGAYDLESGEEIWRMSGGGDIPVPVPIVWEDLLFFNSAHGKHRPLMAVRNSASGEISYAVNTQEQDQDLVWLHDREGAYMTSVLVYKDLLYQLRWNGSLSCFDPRSGEKIYDETVHPTSFIASPVIADDRIYMVSETGDLYVAAAGTSYKLLKKIPLGEASLVTPGIAPGILVLRTASRLIGIAEF